MAMVIPISRACSKTDVTIVLTIISTPTIRETPAKNARMRTATSISWFTDSICWNAPFAVRPSAWTSSTIAYEN